MFLPTTKEEVEKLGWNSLDIILVTGDTYIDSPYIGVAQIGKWLVANGFKVGILAQPDVESPDDITRLGEPDLFWGVTGGSVDSMVANYTSLNKRRKSDDFTPGGLNNKRPDRATLVYTNLIRRFFKNTVPVVLGGIEASLRRITHYDFKKNELRRSVLLDAKADYLVYGMGEGAILELANAFQNKTDLKSIRGISYLAPDLNGVPENYLELASHEDCVLNKSDFESMYNTFYENTDPKTARGLVQKIGDRYLVQNPPQIDPSQVELDSYYNLEYEREVHPYYAKAGVVRALDTIRFSVTTHRGCYGECNFCAITVHQGRTVLSRSKGSVLNEVKQITHHKKFKGIISDVGGPTANMYGFECTKKLKSGNCPDKRCVFPHVCKTLKPDHSPQVQLLQEIEHIDGVKKVFVASGLRYDLLNADKKHGDLYIKRLAQKYTSGQLKIAPEHTRPNLLDLMGKPHFYELLEFKEKYERYTKEYGKKQFLTYYFIAAHPGCDFTDMNEAKKKASQELSLSPEQVQIFNPTPSTRSTLMYYTERNFENGKKIFVEKDPHKKERQKNILVEKPSKIIYNQRPAGRAPAGVAKRPRPGNRTRKKR